MHYNGSGYTVMMPVTYTTAKIYATKTKMDSFQTWKTELTTYLNIHIWLSDALDYS